VKRITSLTNPRVKAAVKLHRSHHRKTTGRMLIEGRRCIQRALAAGIAVEEFFVVAAHEGGELVARAQVQGARIYEVPPHILERMAYRENPEGLLAVARAPQWSLDDFDPPADALLVVAEKLEKPGNLGAILRSVDAVGAHGLILCDKHTDITNPNVLTASTGTVFTTAVAEAERQQVVDWLVGRGVRILAADPAGKVPYTAVDMTGPTAIVVGSEHDGLSEAFGRAADEVIFIPMAGRADSLNVAATATVLLFEAARQRSVTQCP